MKKELKEIFVAEDGNVFSSEAACVNHEEIINKEKARLEKIKFYQVVHSPDLTEGRGNYGLTYIAIEENEIYSKNHLLYLIDFCSTQYGNAVQFVQGVSATAGWRYNEITYDEYISHKGKAHVGDYSYNPKIIFLSDCGDYVGFEKAISKQFCHKPLKDRP